jgi:hypothetical protein
VRWFLSGALNARVGSTAVCLWFCIWVALGLYGYFLNSRTVPSGYYTDSLSIVMNAACINEFGADEFEEPYPIVGFRSFGDYPLPIYIYLVALASKFFGPSLYVARIVGMICGLVGVTLIMLIASKLVAKETFQVFGGPLFTLTILSSWIMVPHRLGHDVTVALPATALLVGGTIILLQDARSVWRGLVLGICCGFLPYAYTGTKFLYVTALPLLVATILVSKGPKELRWTRARGVYVAAMVCALMGIPVLVDLLTEQHTLARYRSVGQSNIFRVAFYYLCHANPIFWFIYGDRNLRHHTGLGGMLNFAMLPLLLTGLLLSLKRAWKQRSATDVYILLFFVISFLPASMARGAPHALRTLIAVPPMIILSFWGAEWLSEYARNRIPLRACLLLLVVWCVSGGLAAALTVRYYHEHPCHACWTYFDKPEKQWLSNDRLVPCNDRSLDTLNYRYFRMVERGDMCYCKGAKAK